MKINLGTIILPKEIWERCKDHGYSREDVKQVIIQNGEDSLIDSLDMTLFCKKCGCSGMGGTNRNDCEHEWIQE